jgi:Icc-related predicted phosphoesterase
LTAAQNTENVFFLDSGEALVGSVRFLGTTLWTDFALFGRERQEESMSAAGAAMTDYRRIRLQSAGYRKLRPSDTLLMHEQQKAWLSKKFEEPFSGPTVVVTHMAPSKKSVSSKYEHDLVSAAYASNLDELVPRADLWIHGHMHESFDYRIGKTRVVCNPFGYASKSGDAENSAFNSNFIIDI